MHISCDVSDRLFLSCAVEIGGGVVFEMLIGLIHSADTMGVLLRCCECAVFVCECSLRLVRVPCIALQYVR